MVLRASHFQFSKFFNLVSTECREIDAIIRFYKIKYTIPLSQYSLNVV